MFQSQVSMLVAGLFGLQMAVVFAVLQRTPGMGRAGLNSWVVGDLLVTAATVLLAAHDYLPEWRTLNLADMVMTAALSLMVYGTRCFFGRRGRAGALCLLNLAVLAGAVYFDWSGAPPSGPALLFALANIYLPLALLRVVAEQVPAKRGTGRLAALSLGLIALACAGMGVYQAADLALLPAELALLPAGLAWLAKGPPEETFTLLHAFGIVSLSVSFALMAHDSLRRRLEHRASYDDLTDVLTRGAYWEALEDACKQADRLQRPLTVAFIDLDHFKAINDLYGHLAGDSVLRHFSGLLRKSVRTGDFVGRLGGRIRHRDAGRVTGPGAGDQLAVEYAGARNAMPVRARCDLLHGQRRHGRAAAGRGRGCADAPSRQCPLRRQDNGSELRFHAACRANCRHGKDTAHADFAGIVTIACAARRVGAVG
ncbi:GGDEF domain-containing protein [Cupriavidus basilensis]